MAYINAAKLRKMYGNKKGELPRLECFLAFILNDVDETFRLNFYKKKGAFGDGEPRQARAKLKTYNCHSERSEESFGKRSFVPQDDKNY